ncbi:MAG: PEP-CTERM sorting domain-containing protein [Planctomycetota bacterium]
MKLRNILNTLAGCAALTLTGNAFGAVATDIFLFEDTNELNFDFQATGDGNIGFFADPAVPSLTANVITTTIADGFSGTADTGIDVTISGVGGDVFSGFGGAIGVIDEGLVLGESLVFTFDAPMLILGSNAFFAGPNTLTFTAGGGQVGSITADNTSAGLLNTPISLGANETLTVSVSNATPVFLNDLLVVVPEPASGLLVGAGALLLCGRRRFSDS